MSQGMKDSGIQWLGSIPDLWNIKRVKYTASLKGRIGWQGLTSEEYQDDGAFLITGVDFKNGGIDWENCVHVPMKRWEEAREIQIQNGDLLITKDGTIGKVALVSNMPGATSLNSGVLRIILVEGYSRRFLFWVLQSEVFWNWFNFKNAGNSTILHLYQGDFAEFIYAFPEYPEQELIADFLDGHCEKLDSIIADLEKQIDTLQRYKKFLITETVTKGLDRTVPMKDSEVAWIGEIPKHWDIKPLNSVSTLRNGYVGPTRDLFVESGVEYLQSLHIKEGEITFENYPPYYVPESWAKLHPRIHTNDVLFVQTGEIGQVGLVRSQQDNYSCHALIIATPESGVIEGAFLRYYFLSTSGQDSLLMYQTGTTLLHLNSTKIKHSLISVPPLAEQILIIDYLDDKCSLIQSTIRKKEAELEKVKSYKASLIYEYVTGKKRVKEVI